MEKEDWKKVSDWWGLSFYDSIQLSIDGYKITLFNRIDKKRMIVRVEMYVDGVVKGEYLGKESEIGNRFLHPAKVAVFSAKELKEKAKCFGKKHKYAQQIYKEYNEPIWKSFAAFKKHITQNNKDIKLIEE